MYLNDLQRTDFYSTIGLDTKKFDEHVIRKTNQSSGTLFPIVLDVDHPEFFKYLDMTPWIGISLQSDYVRLFRKIYIKTKKKFLKWNILNA